MEKRPIESKKFLSFLIAELTWKAAIVILLLANRESIPVGVLTIGLAIVIVAGFVEVGYILGQASLDRFVRVAEITAEKGIPKDVAPVPGSSRQQGA